MSNTVPKTTSFLPNSIEEIGSELKYITGIGSRETPFYTLAEMRRIGEWCRENKVFVRSGHSVGADYAFEKGATSWCHAYLPWPRFNEELPATGAVLINVEYGQKIVQAEGMVNQIHPKPTRLTPGARNLHVRNCFQVLGAELWEPSQAVVCWTKGGKAVGGTATAINLAINNKIPVLNMHDSKFSSAEKVIAELNRLYRK